MTRAFLIVNTNVIRPPVSPVGLEYIAETLVNARMPVQVLDLAFEVDWKASLRKQLSTFKSRPSLKAVVKGKIDYLGMIRGKDDPIYLDFRQKLRQLAPELVKHPETPFEFLTRTSRKSPVKSAVSAVLSTSGDANLLPRLLSAVEPQLESKWRGAWETFQGTSADKLRQASFSMREVISSLLRTLAPDNMVKTAPWYTKLPNATTPVIRKIRVRYCLSGCSMSVSHSTLDYIESLAGFVDQAYAKLSSEAHSDKPLDIASVEALLKSGDIVILMILLNRKT